MMLIHVHESQNDAAACVTVLQTAAFTQSIRAVMEAFETLPEWVQAATKVADKHSRGAFGSKRTCAEQS